MNDKELCEKNLKELGLEQYLGMVANNLQANIQTMRIRLNEIDAQLKTYIEVARRSLNNDEM